MNIAPAAGRKLVFTFDLGNRGKHLYRARIIAPHPAFGKALRLTANGWTHTLHLRARGVIGALMKTEKADVETVREAGAAGGAEPEAVEALLVLWVRRAVLHVFPPHD